MVAKVARRSYESHMTEVSPKQRYEMDSAPEVLVLDRVVKRSGRKVVLKNVNLRMRAGEMLTIVGGATRPKSLLTRLLNGQLSPDEGSLLRAGPPSPMLGMPMGFNMGGTVLRGLELRAAAYGLELDPYVNAVASLLPKPEVLRSALTDLAPSHRQTILYGSALLLPCTHFISDSNPLPADKPAKKALRPLFRKVRKKAAFITLSKRMTVNEQFPNQRFLRLYDGELITMEEFEKVTGQAKAEKAQSPEKAA